MGRFSYMEDMLQIYRGRYLDKDMEGWNWRHLEAVCLQIRQGWGLQEENLVLYGTGTMPERADECTISIVTGTVSWNDIALSQDANAGNALLYLSIRSWMIRRDQTSCFTHPDMRLDQQRHWRYEDATIMILLWKYQQDWSSVIASDDEMSGLYLIRKCSLRRKTGF